MQYNINKSIWSDFNKWHDNDVSRVIFHRSVEIAQKNKQLNGEKIFFLPIAILLVGRSSSCDTTLTCALSPYIWDKSFKYTNLPYAHNGGINTIRILIRLSEYFVYNQSISENACEYKNLSKLLLNFQNNSNVYFSVICLNLIYILVYWKPVKFQSGGGGGDANLFGCSQYNGYIWVIFLHLYFFSTHVDRQIVDFPILHNRRPWQWNQ